MNSSMEKPYVVGIDIGGTNTVFGIVDARGTIIASGSIKTGAHDQADDYVDAVCKNLLPLIIANGGVDKIKGIGIGAPNGNYYSGTIEFAPTTVLPENWVTLSYAAKMVVFADADVTAVWKLTARLPV